MTDDLEIELRVLLKRQPMRVHILNTKDGMVIAKDYPYHHGKTIKLPEQLERAILELYAPSVS